MTFHIKKVTVTGSGKTPSYVTFKEGLNIICGVSDSGKTCILKSIQFAMGVINKPFNKKKTGYECVALDVMTKYGLIQFTRKLGRNIVDVSCKSSEIESREYDIKYNSKGNDRPVLNELWLKIIGIEGLPMIISSQDFKRQRLSWKTILGLIWLEEQEIENPNSVLLPSTPTQNPYFFSCLLYLLTGQSFPDEEEQDKEEISKAKKDAVRQFVNGQINAMSEKQNILEKELTLFRDLNLEEEMEMLTQNLLETEKAINSATEESKYLLNKHLELKERETEVQLTRAHFKSLKTQYISDIKRLTFIVESEGHIHSISEINNCPFCDGTMEPKHQDSYIEASKYELSSLIQQLQGLTDSENDVKVILNEIQSEIAEHKTKKKKIDEWLETELTPRVKYLTDMLQKYKTYIQLKNEISVLQTVSHTWTSEVTKQENSENGDNDKTKFKPKDHFPVDFNTNIDEIAYSILEECQYEGLHSAHFNKGTFDLEVNGLVKEESHGKGYWAFINTIVGLTFRRYLKEKATYKPGIFVVDTPLLGLDQGVQDNAPENMRTALFQYFIDSQSLGQMIIVENTKDLPELDYNGAGAKVIEFTHNKYHSKYESRYGFLQDVYKDSDI